MTKSSLNYYIKEIYSDCANGKEQFYELLTDIK